MCDLPRRRSLLLTALAILEVDWRDQEPPIVTALRGWLGSRRGLGHVAYGMHAQGFDLELKEFPRGWSASFYPAGIRPFDRARLRLVRSALAGGAEGGVRDADAERAGRDPAG